MKRKFTDLVSMVGTTPAYFSGEKRYVSTGAVDRFSINEADVEIVTYANRPSRANLSAQKNDILFAKMAETLKTLRLDKEQAENIYSTGFCAIRANERLITPQCLYYLVSSPAFLSQKDKHASGATQRAITNTGLANIYVSVPSLEEQKEAVKILDAISSLMAKRKKQLAEIEKLVKSQFIEMFGDMTSNNKGWDIVSLSEIADYFNGLTYKPENVCADGLIVLRSSNIQDSELDFADIVRVNCIVKEKLYVEDGDILMCSRNGSAKLVGKVAEITKMKEPATFGAFMMIIRSNCPKYLLTYFKLPVFREQIKVGTTTTINQITSTMLDKIKLPLPPKERIMEFSQFVEQTDKSKDVDELEVAA